jgi:hypothetical protein
VQRDEAPDAGTSPGSSPQPTLAGFDFPIGVPAADARKAEICSFTQLVEVLADDAADFEFTSFGFILL